MARGGGITPSNPTIKTSKDALSYNTPDNITIDSTKGYLFSGYLKYENNSTNFMATAIILNNEVCFICHDDISQGGTAYFKLSVSNNVLSITNTNNVYNGKYILVEFDI